MFPKLAVRDERGFSFDFRALREISSFARRKNFSAAIRFFASARRTYAAWCTETFPAARAKVSAVNSLWPRREIIQSRGKREGTKTRRRGDGQSITAGDAGLSVAQENLVISTRLPDTGGRPKTNDPRVKKKKTKDEKMKKNVPFRRGKKRTRSVASNERRHSYRSDKNSAFSFSRRPVSPREKQNENFDS